MAWGLMAVVKSVPVIGIDAALRATGLGLIDADRTCSRRVAFPKGLHRDRLYDFAVEQLEMFLGKIRPWVAAVEYPPETIRKDQRGKDGKKKPIKYEGATLGFASATWAAACRALGIQRVYTVEVRVWRDSLIRPFKGRAGAKIAARARAEKLCRRWGAPRPRNHDEAEALCIAEWGDCVHRGIIVPEGRR